MVKTKEVKAEETQVESSEVSGFDYLDWKPEAVFNPETIEFGKMLGSFRRKMAGTHLQIHVLGTVAIYYAQTYDDYDRAGRFMTALLETPTVRTKGIEAWMHKHSNIRFKIAGTVAKAVKNKSGNSNSCDWEAAYRNPYWLDSDSDEQVDNYTASDAFQSLESFRKRLANILDGKTKVKPEPSEVESLRFILKSVTGFIAKASRESRHLHDDDAADKVESGLDAAEHDADESTKVSAAA